jgi:hypothetical protein
MGFAACNTALGKQRKPPLLIEVSPWHKSIQADDTIKKQLPAFTELLMIRI